LEEKTSLSSMFRKAVPGRNKYGATAVVVDGLRFDSKREAARWGELKLLQRAGLIAELERQIRYPMLVNDQLICTYVADFRYRDRGRIVVEDVKSAITRREPTYRLKVKLLKALHGIEVFETE
jgi:hypothetical protein